MADCALCRVPFSPSLCTADTDPLRLNDSMKSFPSGHAQLAVCSAVFLSLYLARRLAGPARLVGHYNIVLVVDSALGMLALCERRQGYNISIQIYQVCFTSLLRQTVDADGVGWGGGVLRGEPSPGPPPPPAGRASRVAARRPAGGPYRPYPQHQAHHSRQAADVSNK